jgi:hypothetical protein
LKILAGVKGDRALADQNENLPLPLPQKFTGIKQQGRPEMVAPAEF